MKIFLLLLLPMLSLSQENYQYKNLVFEGGGIRGFGYPGAVHVLEKKGIINSIERTAGTSAGAIIAMMISLGYSGNEIATILDDMKLNKFKDGKSPFGLLHRVKKEYGFFKGKRFERWLGKIIENKTGNADLTFTQLHELHLKDKIYKDLYCTGTNITQQRLDIFSWQHTPGMKLKTAVHASSCIPLYFTPVAVDSNLQAVSLKKNKGSYDIYIDGGMLANYPVNIFDTCLSGLNPLDCDKLKYNKQTLGLKLERQDQIEYFNKNRTDVAPFKIRSLNDFLSALLNRMMETFARKTPDLNNEAGRTIYISHGALSGKLKRISSSTKKALFDNGVAAAERFFKQQRP